LHELRAIGAACRVRLDGAELVAAEAAVAGLAHRLRHAGDTVAGDAILTFTVTFWQLLMVKMYPDLNPEVMSGCRICAAVGEAAPVAGSPPSDFSSQA